MQTLHPCLTEGNWVHITCETEDARRNLLYFKAVEKVLAEAGEESKPCNEGNRLHTFPTNQGVSLARRASQSVSGASPALPTEDAQSGGSSGYVQGGSASSGSNEVGEAGAPSFSSSAQLPLLLEDVPIAHFKSQSSFP